jgi:hypothetical protein
MELEVSNGISPERTKAKGRVKSPISKSKPLKVSIMPPATNSGGRCGKGNGAGNPNNFCVPCTPYTEAAIILRMLKKYGDHRFTGVPSQRGTSSCHCFK